MATVSDIRRAGTELDVRAFVRELRRQARWYLPKGTRKATVNATVARRLGEGDVPMPAGLEVPPYLVLVGVRRHFGVEYCWRCPGCWRPRRFLYQWRNETIWRCRRCWNLRYTSQVWGRWSPLRRALLGDYELEVLAQRLHASAGRVGRPPHRQRARLEARYAQWCTRLEPAMDAVPWL